MTAVESCPDDLFARARAGSISLKEQDQLDRHIASCSACRAMLFLSRGFEQRLPAQAGDTQVLARMLGKVKAARSPAPAPAAVTAAGAAQRRRRRLGVLLVAAALTGGVATASAVPSARGFVERVVASLVTRGEPAPSSAKGAAPIRQSPPVAVPPAAPMPAADPEGTAPVDPPPPAPNAASVSSERKPSATAGVASRAEQAPTAARLFADASARRKAGDTAGARRLYIELAKRYPGSPEAQVSSASLGRLLLERADDPAGALEQFDRLLARPAANMAQPALAEEALFGRATALMRLGRATEEKKTWLELLKRYPGSVYAERANERLRALK